MLDSETNESLQTGDEILESLKDGADSAPATGENPEEQNLGESTSEAGGDTQQPEGEGNDPAGFTKRMHQKHHEVMEARRRAEELERENAELKKQIPQAQRPEIPPIPDPYSDNYEAEMEARDKAIRDAEAYDAEQARNREQENRQAEQNLNQQREQLKTAVEGYSQKAAELQVDPEELKVAGQTVAAYGVSNQLTQYILGHEQGPLITTHLAKNPAEIDAMQGMTSEQAAVHIATVVVPKVVSGKKPNTPPPPADTLEGGGAPPKERGPKGAKYE